MRLAVGSPGPTSPSARGVWAAVLLWAADPSFPRQTKPFLTAGAEEGNTLQAGGKSWGWKGQCSPPGQGRVMVGLWKVRGAGVGAHGAPCTCSPACQGVGLSPVLVSLGWVYFRDEKPFCPALAGSGVYATEGVTRPQPGFPAFTSAGEEQAEVCRTAGCPAGSLPAPTAPQAVLIACSGIFPGLRLSFQLPHPTKAGSAPCES